MAAAAPTGASYEVLHTTHKKANFQRIARLLVAGGTALMREIFDQYFNTPLQFHLKLNVPFVKNKIKRAKLTKPQMDCLYPKTGTCNKNSKDFDISLLHKLFKTICNLNPPASGWDAFPPPTDHSKAADLTRIKQYRNKIFHDYSDMEMDDTEFNSLWNDIREALLRVARSISPSTRSAWERAIEKLYTAPLTPEDESKVRELKKMYENEVRSKEEIKNIEKALQVGLDSVHQAIKRTGDDVHQAIKRTGDDVHQAMQKGFSGLHQAIKETMMKNFHPIVEKKNDSGTSPQLTESALVGRAQNGNSPANRRAPALCKPSTLGTDPHLPEAGLSTPPERMLTATLTPTTGSGSRQLPAVDKVRDLGELCKIAAAVGMKTENFETIKEIQEKLHKHIKEKRQESRKTFEVISEAGKADEHKRSELLRLYIETREILNQLDDEFMNPLETSLGDIKTALEENIRSLAPRDQYVVLVAGETSAGKSSVINLILGEEILPSAVLGTTSTMFELKYDKTPKVVIHFNDSRETMYYKLVGPKESFQEQIKSLVSEKNERGRVSPYKKIELFWPHPLFQERVIIVDSPGVGDNNAMNEAVLNYLPNAFCFIYVINSTNAGGVQEDRLGKLLSNAASCKREAKMDLKLFAGCALFVCNKWDEIKPHEVEEVKLEQIKRLTKKLGGLDPHLQVVYLSCKDAQLAQEYGVIRSDFDDLIRGISNLLVSSMQNNLDIYTRWLDDLLSRVSRQVTLSIRSTTLSRLEKDRKMREIKKRMEELKRSQNETIKELGKYQTQLIWEITGRLAFYFKATGTSTRFCEWSPAEVPDSEATWAETDDEILRSISKRIHQFVQEWEDEEHEFAKAQDTVIKNLCEKYNIMEEEIRRVEDEVLFENGTAEVFQQEICTANPLSIPEEGFQNGPIASKTPVWLRQGLASVVIRSPLSKLVSKLKERLDFSRKLSKYQTDPCTHMSERCTASLEILSDQDRLLPFITEQLEDSVQVLNQIKEKIPKLIEGDEQLYRQLLSDTRSKADIQNFYEPIGEKLESLKGEVIVYALKEIRRSDFSDGDLKWTEDDRSIVGRGSLSTVYSGVLSPKEEKEIKVALRVHTDLLSKENVGQFWNEDMTMREIRGHPSIVEFYGTHLLRGPEGTKVVMVSELCKDSIEKYILSNRDQAPFCTRNKVLHWAVQIVDALCFIHSKELSHQNLKLKNVLLTQDENVKLKGIGSGSFRVNKDIIEDNTRYLAPEVLESKCRNYDSKSDMFSFSILLWELWFCEKAFQSSITSHSQHLQKLKMGLRPTHLEGKDRPWQVWTEVMEICWEGEASARLTAEESWNRLRRLEYAQRKTQPVRTTPPPKPS